MVGSSSLRLYRTANHNALIWDQKIPKAVKIATFSQDSSLIASTGHYDRLIKLWRRQSFGSDDTRFDFAYLPHPTAVTAVHWKRSKHRELTVDSVLFSICADSKVRIWAATDPHGVQTLQLWAEIDMQESIQPREISDSNCSNERFAFVIDSNDFAKATEQALRTASTDGEYDNHALEHLKEVAKTSPEVCVIVDKRGNMSAWGLENIGCRVRKNTDKFNVAHVENVDLLFLQDVKQGDNHVQFLCFCNADSDSPFSLLVHHFDGRILWFETRLDELFDPSPGRTRLRQRALWTGHNGSIKKIVRSTSGNAVISRTNENEGLIWKHNNNQRGMILSRSSSLSSLEHIYRTCLLREGDFAVSLHHHSISIWDARCAVAERVASCTFELKGRPLCLLPLPCPNWHQSSFYLATITTKFEAIVWEINLPPLHSKSSDGHQRPTITQFCTSNLGFQADLASVLPLDLAESPPKTTDLLDTFAKDLAISCTTDGMLRTWAALIDLEEHMVFWLATSTIYTNIDGPSLASGNSIRKIAVVDRQKIGLTIWDSRSGHLEHDASYSPSDTIQDLDWVSTPDNQSILAVGFPYKIVILAQIRYDYLDAGAAWVSMREIRIKELTSHPIGDSCWLASGNLVIGAGTQLYIYDKDVITSHDMVTNLSIKLPHQRSLNMFDLITHVNGPLPVFHPQFLMQCILAGKMLTVQQVIVGLYEALKFFVAGDEIDDFVSIPPIEFYMVRNHIGYCYYANIRRNLSALASSKWTHHM